MELKKCALCNKYLPISNFYVNRPLSKKYGSPKYRTRCKKCGTASNIFYRTNPTRATLFIPIDGENWLPVVGYEGLYEVSDLGRIVSFFHKEKRLLHPWKSHGYRRVTLVKNGIEKSTAVHILEGTSFLPNPENKPTVNHKNGIRDDNRLVNLEWATMPEQQDHAIATGLRKIILRAGEMYNSSVTNEQALEIFNSILPPNELSKIYNISIPVVKGIKCGARYSSITGKKFTPIRRAYTDEQVLAIFNSPLSPIEASLEYGVSINIVRNIRYGKIKSDLTGKI